MKKYLIILLLFFSVLALARGQKSSVVNLHAGLLFNQGNFFKLYDGVANIGLGYHTLLFYGLYGGFDFDAGLMSYKNTPARTTVYRPKISILYVINVSPRIAIDPSVGFGYGFVRITNSEYAFASVAGGVNYETNLKLKWKSEGRFDYFLYGSYAYFYLNKNESFTMLHSLRQIHLYSFGIGVNIKPGINE